MFGDNSRFCKQFSALKLDLREQMNDVYGRWKIHAERFHQGKEWKKQGKSKKNCWIPGMKCINYVWRKFHVIDSKLNTFK